jgi:hypothetical protein
MPRPVGHIRAVRVDWLPVTGNPPSDCRAPDGSSVLAASPDATITIDRAPDSNTGIGPGFSVLGCLTSDGRERLLQSQAVAAVQGEPAVGSVVIAGNYAALVDEASDIHYYGGSLNGVVVFDLRTGAAVASAGGESANCPLVTQRCGIDQLVLGADGDTAAHTFVLDDPTVYPSCTSVEQIVANDSTGTHVLDSITTTNPCNSPAPALVLSQLSLSGDTLTWNHAGTPESAQLN